MVTEFLKYARPLEISTETVPLQPMIERVVDEIGEAMPRFAFGTKVHLATCPATKGCYARRFLIWHATRPKLAEAPNGGRVLIRGESVRANEDGFQRVTVFDNGAGITPGRPRKTVSPIFHYQSQGTGLGLAVVQKIIVQHGGQVRARNRTEGGAAFIVTLPLARGSRKR